MCGCPLLNWLWTMGVKRFATKGFLNFFWLNMIYGRLLWEWGNRKRPDNWRSLLRLIRMFKPSHLNYNTFNNFTPMKLRPVWSHYLEIIHSKSPKLVGVSDKHYKRNTGEPGRGEIIKSLNVNSPPDRSQFSAHRKCP